MLQEATDGGTVLMQATYAYDAFGNRLEKDVWTQSSGLTTTTRFGYDGWKVRQDASGTPASYVGAENWDVWADLSGSNSLTTRYVHGDGVDELYATVSSGGAVSGYLSDHLGSVRVVTNAAGSALDTVSYDAWGNVASESNPPARGRPGYAGYEYDAELGVYNDRERPYAPSIARFTGQDRLGVRPAEDNLYDYVRNGPTNATDPSGQLLLAQDRKTALQLQEWLLGGKNGYLASGWKAGYGAKAVGPGIQTEIKTLFGRYVLVPKDYAETRAISVMLAGDPEKGDDSEPLFPGMRSYRVSSPWTRNLLEALVSPLVVREARWVADKDGPFEGTSTDGKWLRWDLGLSKVEDHDRVIRMLLDYQLSRNGELLEGAKRLSALKKSDRLLKEVLDKQELDRFLKPPPTGAPPSPIRALAPLEGTGLREFDENSLEARYNPYFRPPPSVKRLGEDLGRARNVLEVEAAVKKHVGELAQWVNEPPGPMKAAGGAFEVMGGVLVLAGGGPVGWVVGAILILHGLDTAIAGMRDVNDMFSDPKGVLDGKYEAHRTLTAQGATKVILYVLKDVPKERAEAAGDAIDAAVPLLGDGVVLALGKTAPSLVFRVSSAEAATAREAMQAAGRGGSLAHAEGQAAGSLAGRPGQRAVVVIVVDAEGAGAGAGAAKWAKGGAVEPFNVARGASKYRGLKLTDANLPGGKPFASLNEGKLAGGNRWPNNAPAKGAPGMAKAPGYQLPADVADFANRYQEPLNAAIGNRMRQVGVPDEMVGIKYYGVDEGAFVRYDPPQLGGNIRVGTNGKPGINVDPAVFDANAPQNGTTAVLEVCQPTGSH
ncbi:MAG TPA: RHS repeat-associated core domain-containing protein [Gemmataceae bacterium]|nr:RHS repeat-associated core domain-containing protein [Gemmataceae bacterium]